jgi:hypothetical protein
MKNKGKLQEHPIQHSRNREVNMMTFAKAQNRYNKTIDMDKDMIHKVKAGRSGKEIRCLGGTVWITQTGDGIDRILTGGDIYQTRISGDIVIQAMDSAKIRVSEISRVEVLGNNAGRLQPQLACA